jgi:outer membrane protein
MSIRLPAVALVAAIVSAPVAAQYTVKVGGAYIDPHATSAPLIGGVSPRPAGGFLQLNGGVQLDVQPTSTLILSIERALSDNWSVEFLLGAPPKHDVKLKVDNPQVSGANVLPSAAQGAAVNGLLNKLAAQNNQVIATVRQWSPTVFFNYRFLSADAAFRPFVGLGLNVTRFKASTTPAGDTLYADGSKPEISLSDSIGPAIQLGASYRLDQNWSLNASVATARVDNKLTIVTRSGLRQESSFRFNPTVVTATVGYSF